MFDAPTGIEVGKTVLKSKDSDGAKKVHILVRLFLFI